MSKRDTKNIALLVILLVYSIVYRLFIYKNMLSYSESITSAVIILLTFLAIKFLGFQKNKKTKMKQYITNVTIVMIILFFVLSYGIGLFVGFLSNSYSRTIEAIISNTFCQLIIIIATEIFRYTVIRANKDKKYVVVFATIIITIFELVTTLQPLSLTDYAGLFRTITATALPIISKNIVISYLVYHIGYVPGLIYRLVMDLYIYIMPIVPDLGDYLNSMLGIGLPFLIYLYASRTINEYNNGVERNYGTETFKLIDIPFITFMVVLICLISGFFPYYMIGIGSESMTPKILKGDAVIIHKISNKAKKNGTAKLEEGQIIAFKMRDKTIVHRLVKIEKKDGVTYYRTKGDANNSNDNINLTINNIYGVVEFKIPYIAKPTIYLTEFLNGER